MFTHNNYIIYVPLNSSYGFSAIVLQSNALKSDIIKHILSLVPT